ncbi:restriction endonuclease subunit S [Brevibacillus sp. 7WMA2]|uniref:restriction endonuclease subunit S n=1 Tax=Brevibacillus sp. 7WMA2 TaxID=2683193 RepID=UPI0013A794DB|nr:restriction endonuclease subunit S [Brevibacillus sp. 7WMA2]QIC07190.1 restriction endonuclease subunit S [Brevibacillus sp. 7WMA2]
MNVPKLRFSGFTGDWEERKLNEASSYSNGGSYENDVRSSGKYQLVTLKSVDMAGNLVDSRKYIDKEVPTLSKGTLVMILSEQSPGLLGMTAQIPENNKYVLNQRVAEIKPNNNTDSYFLSMAINRCQQYFSKRGAGTKVQNISKGNVENFEFYCPIIEEQQKIGYFFKTLDKKIQLQQQKIDLLKEKKKSLMSRIFNPTQVSEWRKIEINEFMEFSTGKSQNEFIEQQGEFTVMDMGAISNEGKIISNKFTNHSTALISQGSLVMPKDDIGGGKIIGLTAYVPKNNKYVLGDHVYLVKVDEKICNPLFAHFQFHSVPFRKRLKRLVTGSAQLGITSKNIVKEYFYLPSLLEQAKIANFLLSLDKKIELEIQKNEFYKLQKQGFIQQMFI